MAEAMVIAAALEIVMAIRQALLTAATNVHKCSHLARRLEVLEPLLRKGTAGSFIAAKPLKSLEILIAQIKECVIEFNKVDRKHKLKRVLRAGEFQSKFAGFNATLNDIVTDLTVVTVSDTAVFMRQWAMEAGQAERADLAALKEEVRQGNSELMAAIREGGTGGKMTSCVQDTAALTSAALTKLQTQAVAQQEQLRVLAASGVSDAAGLCSQLGAIAADASAAAKKKPTGDDSGAEDAENLQRKHADVTARFDMLVTGYSATMSAENKKQAQAAQAAMKASQDALAASIEASRRKETEVLEDIIRSGNAAAKAAAEEMKENVSALSKLHEQDMALLHQQHEQEMALLREVASDTKDVKKMTAQLQAMMAAESSKANSVLSGVLETQAMLAAMQQALDAAAAASPAAQRMAMLAAVQQCTTQLTSTESRIAAVYSACANAELQMALKAVRRQIALVAASMTFLSEKMSMRTELVPRLAVPQISAAITGAFDKLSVTTPPAAVAELQLPLRMALDVLAMAHKEADAALRGSGVAATEDMPPGWPRELWAHAFGRTMWSGPITFLTDGLKSYTGAAANTEKVEAFLSLKQQDFALGGGHRIDALEWRDMAAARDDAPPAQAPGGAVADSMSKQLWLDRFVARAQQQSSPAFQVSVDLTEFAKARKVVSVAAPASSTFRAAKLRDRVQLEVTATQDCYIYVVEQDSSGDIELLLPPRQSVVSRVNNFIRAGQRRLIPDPSGADGLQLAFQPPLGLERVVVLATLAEWPDYFAAAGVQDDAARGVALTRGMRKIAISKTGAAMPAMAVGELRFMLQE